MRYLPLTAADRAEMLETVGASSIDDLFSDVPAAARATFSRKGGMKLPRDRHSVCRKAS